MLRIKRNLEYNEIDRDIWNHDLENFVPSKIFDVHVHCWSEKFSDTDTFHEHDWREYEADLSGHQETAALLYPRRDIHFLLFPQPIRKAKIAELNAWTATDVKADRQSYGALLVTPEITATAVADIIRRYGFIAVKPYHLFARPGDTRIVGYFPEGQMAVVNTFGLAVILHCRNGIFEDLPELAELIKRYPHIQWILAHCGAAFNPTTLERSIEQLRDLPNIWYDTALVCDFYTHALLLKKENRQRILFGTDNVVGGCRRGQVAAYAFGVDWHENLNGATFMVYEQLRAQCRACKLLDVSSTEIENMFYGNAMRLIQQIKTGDCYNG